MWLVDSFVAFLSRGGPAMIALLFCSLLAMAVIIERLLFFAQQHVDAETLVRQLGARIALDDIDGAIAICEQNHGLLPRILETGLLRSGKSRTDISDALAFAARKQSAAFERNLSIIGTIAVISPFVGLFGTVLGIIRAFDDIALKGNSSPAVVAAGVSESLITTAAGLFVAVLSVVFFNYFRARVRTNREEIGWATDQLAEILHYHNDGGLTAGEVARLVGVPKLSARTASAT
jgi:biopolymer transport protein ExbB